jgi:prolyl-tRNA editing enzyme YbaK/EbsC (Cys-tRNA(Pro) deacylase)
LLRLRVARLVLRLMGDPVLDQLDALGVPHEVVPCDPALADTADFCAAYGYDLADSANAILVLGKSAPRSYVVCVVLADSRLDVNGVVRRRLGARKASFASAEETRELTGMEIGGVTPFGLPPELRIWVDERVMARDRIVLGGGSRDRKVVGPPALLTALPGAEVVTDLAQVASEPPPAAAGGASR